MAWWNESIEENGVEVTYSSNCDIYKAEVRTGEYTEKIDVYPNHVEIYSAKDSSWREHSHSHMDENGDITLCHPMEKRSWKDHFRG